MKWITAIASNYVLWGFGVLCAYVLWFGRFPKWFIIWKGPVTIVGKAFLLGLLAFLAFRILKNDQEVQS